MTAKHDIRLPPPFLLARIPWITLLLICGMLCTFLFWQPSQLLNVDDLAAWGAKSAVLIQERGQWWRLLSANFIHASLWHLIINLIFLFNLGGPTEALYRREDYILLVLISSLSTTIFSSMANPLVSCGASGIVFGLWGAAGIFGLRYRTLLLTRYKRYFFGNVIPYSIIALYSGFAFTGIDNWGHLGGLLGGSSYAYFCLPRFQNTASRHVRLKILLTFLVIILIFALSEYDSGYPPLERKHYQPFSGITIVLPKTWNQVFLKRKRWQATYTFANDLGVSFSTHTRLEPQLAPLIKQAELFIVNELAPMLETETVQGYLIKASNPVKLKQFSAYKLHIRVLNNEQVSAVDYYLFKRGNYFCVLAFRSPEWLYNEYKTWFQHMREGIVFSDPDALLIAQEKFNNSPDTRHARSFFSQLLYSGHYKKAREIHKWATIQWPDDEWWENKLEALSLIEE